MNENGKSMTELELWEAIQSLTRQLTEISQQMSSQRAEYLPIEEVARLTGLSEKHIRRATKQGLLPCSNVGGKSRPTYRIARSAIAEWFSNHKICTGTPKPARRELVGKYFSAGRVTRKQSRQTD